MNKAEEYASLRSEIISLVDIQYNYILAMYTISVAIISLAIQQQNEWIFLLPYIILISFQRVISAKRNIMLRIAAYIAVFLDGDFGWEKNYNEITNNTLNKHNNKKKFSWIKNILSGRVSSVQLGIVCSVGCVIININHILEKNNWDSIKSISINELRVVELLPTFLAFLLLVIIIHWSSGAVEAMKVREKYIDSLKQYKKNLEKNEKNNELLSQNNKIE